MTANVSDYSLKTDLLPLTELRDEVVRQYHCFSEFRFLYYRSEICVDLLNAVAKHFFGSLFYMMLEKLVLGVSKLTDPAGSGNRACLSFDYVHNELSHDNRYPADDVGELLTQIEAVRDHLSRWRSKLIAHKDVSVALGHVSLGEVIPARLEEFFEIAQKYLELVFEKFGLGQCPIAAPAIHGADELVKTLKYGMAFTELLEQEPQTYDGYLRASRFNGA
jgi:hypothetical protein